MAQIDLTDLVTALEALPGEVANLQAAVEGIEVHTIQIVNEIILALESLQDQIDERPV